MLDAIRGISSLIKFKWKTEQTYKLCTTFRILIQNDSDNHTDIIQNFCIFQFSTSFEQTAKSSQSAII